jgi:GTPase SAR1 family protein
LSWHVCHTNACNQDNAVFILVLGMTGSGKSTFIRHCTGRSVEIGHGLQSCKSRHLSCLSGSFADSGAGTNDLSVHSFWLAGQHVHLIDTPGFDDTNHSDIDTLKTIASYLSTSYANGVRLTGIVYLHRISDNRLGGSGMRNLRMFKKLSGSSTWPNTAIGTTMWNINEYAEGIAREKELSSHQDYFGDLLSGGAKLFRVAEHATGPEEQKHSSLAMISRLVQYVGISPKLELKIQRELVNEHKSLDATAAGQEALGDLYHIRVQLTEQLESTRHDMREAVRARDSESARQLEAVETDFTNKLRLAEQEQVELKTSLLEMHDKEVQRLLERLDDMDKAQRRHLHSKQKELEDMEESLRLMREQSTIDAARWRKQKLDAAESKRKQRAKRDADHDAAQSALVLKQQVDEGKMNVAAVGKARGMVRNSIVNGISNGVATAGATAVATLGTYLSHAVKIDIAKKTTALGLMCVVS